MNAILLLSKDSTTIAMYSKLAKGLGVRLLRPKAAVKPLPDCPVLADADSWPADPAERAALVTELCAHAATAPTGCFGYRLTAQQRAALDRAGVVVAHGPGRILLRTLASWADLRPLDAALAPDAE